MSSTSAPGLHRAHGSFAGRVQRGHAAHVHRVRDDQAAKFHFVAQQAGQNFVRKRSGNVSTSGSSAGTARWPGMIELTPAAIAARKGTSSVPFEFFAVAGNDGQREMRIHAHVAMPGEMFGSCERAIFFNAANELR